MPGIRALRRIQLGKETTPGTLVAATTIWRGKGTIEDLLEVKYPEEDVAMIAGGNRFNIPRVQAALAMEDTEATYEQVFHIFEASHKLVTTGVADGGGTGKVYTYPFHSLAALNTIRTYTIEGGDDFQEEEFGYGFIKGYKFSGAAGGPVMVSADWVGRQVAPATFTASIAQTVVEDVLFSLGKLYIDAIGGTIGATQKTNTFLEFSLEVTTGWIPYFTGDGQLYFSAHKATMPEVVLKVKFEHETTSVAEKANWRAGTPRLIRVQFLGTALTTPATFTNKTLRFDLAGAWEHFDKIDEKDGNDIVEGTFRARYDATAAKFYEAVVVNQVASVP